MIAQNTNTVNRKPMPQKLENRSETNEIGKLIWKSTRKGKTKSNFLAKTQTRTDRITW